MIIHDINDIYHQPVGILIRFPFGQTAELYWCPNLGCNPICAGEISAFIGEIRLKLHFSYFSCLDLQNLVTHWLTFWLNCNPIESTFCCCSHRIATLRISHHCADPEVLGHGDLVDTEHVILTSVGGTEGFPDRPTQPIKHAGLWVYTKLRTLQTIGLLPVA